MKWYNYGLSSLTLLAVYSGLDIKEPNIPHDPSDFIRCVHLFECLGLSSEESERLVHKTAGKYPVWESCSIHWSELMRLYEEEKHQTKAPKLFEKLQEIRQ